MSKFLDRQEPEITVVKRDSIPKTTLGSPIVDSGFWPAVFRRLTLLHPDEALKIVWNDSAFNHGTAPLYILAKKANISIFVGRVGKSMFIYRKSESRSFLVDSLDVKKIVFEGK